jgi:hypothetical protein
MTTDKNTQRGASSAPSDQIGKVFIVVGEDVRKCLICDGVFTKQGSAAHADAVCHPPNGNSELDGENHHANR